MLDPEFKINKAFKEQVESNPKNSFSGATVMSVRKAFKKRNTNVLSLLVFYENIKNMIFKLSSLIFYCIIDNYACIDHLCCPQNKLHVTNN